MSDLKQLIRNNHPFVLILYLTVVAVAATLLFDLGRTLSGGDKEPEQSAQRSPLKGGATNVWTLPPFSLEDTDGVLHSLKRWQGKVILLNFWATWCPPCKYEIPDFMEYQAEYAAAGFQIVGIAVDDPQQVKAYYDEMGINYPVLITTDGTMMGDWGNREQVLPYSVVIDRAGEVRYIHRGQLDRPIFDRQIKPLIEQP